MLPYPTRGEYLRRLADAYNRTRLTPVCTNPDEHVATLCHALTTARSRPPTSPSSFPCWATSPGFARCWTGLPSGNSNPARSLSSPPISDTRSRALCEQRGCLYLTSEPCRGRQQDQGARAAQAGILWFLHADATPCPSSLGDITRGPIAGGAEGGTLQVLVSRRPDVPQDCDRAADQPARETRRNSLWRPGNLRAPGHLPSVRRIPAPAVVRRSWAGAPTPVRGRFRAIVTPPRSIAPSAGSGKAGSDGA